MADKIVVRDRACRQCGKRPISGYKYCSDTCLHKHTYARRAAQPGFAERNRASVQASYDRRYGPKPNGLRRRKRIAPHPCEVCGQITQRPKTCSYRCAKRTERAKASGYRATAMRRARVRGAKVEPVDRLRVFDRDGWICHLCGKATDRAKLGTAHPDAPELEHVVPLTMGGEHSYANTACSHRRCNMVKGNRWAGGGMSIAQTA